MSLHWRIIRRPLSHVILVLMPISTCHLVFTMCLPLFKGALSRVWSWIGRSVTSWKTSWIVLCQIISREDIKVDSTKVELILNLPSPTTVKEVRQFLGHMGFYRRFIQDFSKISLPLFPVLLKNVEFVWIKACQEAFEKLKSLISTTPIVRPLN